MTDKDYAPLSMACVRALIDKQYEKRKAAAAEIEKMVRDFLDASKKSEIKKLLKILGHEFAISQNPNYRKGGLIGLAAVAVALGKDSVEYIDGLVKPILTNFSDGDLRIRYYACESLYNVAKVARGAVLPHFTEIFCGLSKLATDPDQSVKNGSELLDRLMKDIVTESATFDLVGFMPLLRERLYSTNTSARMFIISWVFVLDAVPDINLIVFLPEILDGLFHMLTDPTIEIKRICETVLTEFLLSINKNPSQVDFEAMINVLITNAQLSEFLPQFIAITWLKVFLELSRNTMLPYISGILTAILPCLSHEGESKKSTQDLARHVNRNLLSLINVEMDLGEETCQEDVERAALLDLLSILEVLNKQLLHTSVHTKLAALQWLHHMFWNIPRRMLLHVDMMFPILLKVVSDTSDEVVLQGLEVFAQIINPPHHDNYQPDRSPYFNKFLIKLLKMFKNDCRILEERGSFIIRHLSVLINAEELYQSIASILRTETDHKFVRVMVDALNRILLTSSELFELRSKLKQQEDDGVFESLYETWCHNAVATVTLCLLTQNYAHASDLISILGNYELTVEFLAEVDHLVQLIESPIFAHMRLQFLDVEKNYHLIKAMYGILMILPQTEAFHTLSKRLDSVPRLHLYGSYRGITGGEGVPNRYQCNFSALKQHFINIQELHKEKKKLNVDLRPT